jgi:hypothetical protein
MGRYPVLMMPKPEDLPCKAIAPSMDDSWRNELGIRRIPVFCAPFGTVQKVFLFSQEILSGNLNL